MKKILIKIKLFFTNLTGKIAFYPSLLAFCGLLLGFIMLYAENKGITQFLLDNIPTLVINDADTARALLSTFIGGIISLMVFSFSMVMILLNQASNNYSPRILPGLISNKRHQLVLGFYIATLTYSILILLSISPTDEEAQLPGFAVLVGIIMGLIVLALFIYFIHSISSAIQINTIIENIFNKAKNRLSGLLDQTDESHRRNEFPDTDDWNEYCIDKTGYLQTIALDSLLEFCSENECKVKIIPAKGTFILKGVPVALCSVELEEDEEERLLSCFSFSRSEIVGHNYVLGFKQLTEIAVKAMSPGINDPGTAITCIDYLTELFALRLQKEDYSYIKNDDDEAVIRLRTINFSELIYYVFAPLRRYCKSDVIMLHKMLMALYYLQHSETVLENAGEVLIKEVNRILEDVKNNIDNESDMKHIFDLRDKIDRFNNTDIELVSL